MTWQYEEIIPLLVATALAVSVAAFIYRRRQAPGARALMVLIFGAAIWSAGTALASTGEDPETQAGFFRFIFLGVLLMPASWLVLAFQYVGKGHVVRPARIALLGIEPIAVLLLVWTNDGHGLIWRDAWFETVSGAPRLAVAYGPAFWVHVVYSYALVALGAWTFLGAFRSSHRAYRRQIATVLLAAAAPALGHLSYILEVWPFEVDPTPMAAAIGGVTLMWALFRTRLLDIVPVARGAVLDRMTEGVMVLDDRGRVVDINPAACAIAGLTAAEAIGISAHQALSGTGLGLPPGSRDYHGEFCLRRDGATHFYDARLEQVYGKNVQQAGFLVIIRDVTAQKRVQEILESERAKLDVLVRERTRELQDTNERLRSEIAERRAAEHNLASEREKLDITMRNMSDGVVVADNFDRITMMNPAAERLTGRKRGDSLNDSLGGILPRFEGMAFAEGLEGLPVNRPFEVDTDETPKRVFQIAISRIADEHNVGGHVVVFRDITVQRMARQDQEQEQRLASLGKLAAGIAHDFNNLLTGNMGLLKLLQEEPDTSEPVREMAAKLAVRSDQASQLVRQILDFSRQGVAPKLALDFSEVLTETFDMLKQVIPESIQASLKIEPGAYMVNGDATQLPLAIMNLALNARDAMPRGGELRFRLAGAPPESQVSGAGPDTPRPRRLELTVSDTGIGMSEGVARRIFDPFFTTKDRGRGVGLGLAQVYGIVKQHEGEIAVESRLGAGTTFRLLLPVLKSAVPQPPVKPRDDVPEGKGERILLVEDDPLVLDVLTMALESLNYQVRRATNGNEALMTYASHQKEIDLVLTDVTMPELGGIELFRALKERDKDVRVIAMTGYTFDEDARRYLSEGIVQWLQKPPDMLSLARALRRGLQGSERGAALPACRD